MRYVYPVTLEQDEDGRFVATATDVPEAITDGATAEEALREMSDALGTALAAYSLAGRDIPRPSDTVKNACSVPVAPLVAAKLALRSAMQEQGITNVELARRLDISEGAVRRLVDPDHASRLDGVVDALAVLGHSLIVEDQKQDAA
ncbi:winged helix-turn-helix transcriptional regulator [Thiohalophilus sp.]|uniref:winged helix-turn-helix transcriptional regulator n=1 Tax=Thiohalophilus sp. TaxID=3028392 RepID=UPI002ACD86F9|nr:winged helix-turn-helix transcriptional regulator [Thiohalophilus sp.]MDZ7662830.1 winged helix-turn-helix transcriptional regulator [Thiohalophilus sp.]